MNPVLLSLLIKWVLFGVSNIILVVSVAMMFKAKKVSPIVSTGLFVVGMTMMIVFGQPDLLQNTIGVFVK